MLEIVEDDSDGGDGDVLSQTDKDMAAKFEADLDSFLDNFIEVWCGPVDPRVVVTTIMAKLQRHSFWGADVLVDTSRSGDESLDILKQLEETATELDAEIREKYNLKPRPSND